MSIKPVLPGATTLNRHTIVTRRERKLDSTSRTVSVSKKTSRSQSLAANASISRLPPTPEKNNKK